jgi:hypothetical protein
LESIFSFPEVFPAFLEALPPREEELHHKQEARLRHHHGTLRQGEARLQQREALHHRLEVRLQQQCNTLTNQEARLQHRRSARSQQEARLPARRWIVAELTVRWQA